MIRRLVFTSVLAGLAVLARRSRCPTSPATSRSGRCRSSGHGPLPHRARAVAGARSTRARACTRSTPGPRGSRGSLELDVARRRRSTCRRCPRGAARRSASTTCRRATGSRTASCSGASTPGAIPTIDGELDEHEGDGHRRRATVVTGDLTFRGVTRRVRGRDDDHARSTTARSGSTGESTFDIRDFGMEPPRILMLSVAARGDGACRDRRREGGLSMCLGIPGQIVELLGRHEHLARVDVSGVGRIINIGLLEDEDLAARRLGAHPRRVRDVEDRRGGGGAWRSTALQLMGQAYADEVDALADVADHRRRPRSERDAVRRRVPRPGGRARARRAHHRRSPATTTSSSWRCAAATPTPSTATASSTCCPSNVELVHGPGLPGVRDPDGPGRRRHRGRRDARRDLHVVRRHDARARRQREPARGQGAGRRRALRLLAARRAAASRSRHPDREVVFFAVGFETTAPSTARHAAAGPRARRHQLPRVLQPRHDRPADQGDPRVARPAPRRLPRARARVDGGRQPPVPLRARAVRQAARDRRLRAARHPPGHRHAARPDPRGPLRGREPVHAGRARRGQPARARSAGRGVRAAAALRVARPRLHLAERAEAAARVRRLRRRAALRRCPACGSPTRRRASAARC